MWCVTRHTSIVPSSGPMNGRRVWETGDTALTERWLTGSRSVPPPQAWNDGRDFYGRNSELSGRLVGGELVFAHTCWQREDPNPTAIISPPITTSVHKPSLSTGGTGSHARPQWSIEHHWLLLPSWSQMMYRQETEIVKSLSYIYIYIFMHHWFFNTKI